MASVLDVIRRAAVPLDDGGIDCNAIIHVDQTRALDPLGTWARHDVDLPETNPTGV